MPNTEARKDAIKRLTFKKVALDTHNAVKRLEMEVESFAAEDADSTQYGEQKIQSIAEKSVATAGNVTLEAARSACIKFKMSHEVLTAQENKIPPENPEGFLASTEIVEERRSNSVKEKLIQNHVAEQHSEAAEALGAEGGAYSGVEPQSVHRTVAEKQKISLQKQQMEQFREQTVRRGAIQKYLEKNDSHRAKAAKLPRVGKKQTASEGVRQMTSDVWQRIKALASKAVSKVSSAAWPVLLVCVIVLLVVLMFGSIAAIVGSPMGILVADEANDPNSIPISTIVQEINAEFEEELERVIASHPECDEVNIHYQYPEGRTWKDFWPEILALYAVDANMNRGEDVVVLDTESKNRIREIFRQMHNIDAVVEMIEVPEIVDSDEENAGDNEMDTSNDITEVQGSAYYYILNISICSKKVDQMYVEHGVSQEQIDVMHELLAEPMRTSLLAICNG